MTKCKQFTFAEGDTTIEATIEQWLRKNRYIQVLHAQFLQLGGALHYIILYHQELSEWDTTPCVNC